MSEAASRPWIVGISGASGAVYGIRLCEALLSLGEEVRLVITDAGWRVLKDEHGWQVTNRLETLQAKFDGLPGSWRYYPIQDIGAGIASGSYRTKGMVVIPCSMGTLGAIAGGLSDNLLERAADVMLKEGRKLILVPRETPVHAIHLQNMLTLAQMGATIVPAMPGFYHQPTSIEQMIDFMVGKVLDCMDIDHDLYKRWGDRS
ncbi:UbiX family flavin prenyltransferase [Paenibacillus turpanensis]|uniref:UbiX family flavin prenyltransferase n=1 Tax=Paenibacillus turpanensis TaxID=2689078 RepID=UPI00140CCF4B|nr:flavin prenyltransferase UbiX [Paenibacillus turpanensis]